MRVSYNQPDLITFMLLRSNAVGDFIKEFLTKIMKERIKIWMRLIKKRSSFQSSLKRKEGIKGRDQI
jgi:hypothetical protein